MSDFTPRAQQVVALARKEAERFNHNYVGTEHLLLGLIKDARVARVRPRSDRASEKGRAGSCHRPQERDRTRNSDPLPTHQKQPGADR
jgi:ATP-dependent Clp protease ATP-binding subunit ClpA